MMHGSMNIKFINIIGNQTRDLPTCSAVPQPTALPRAPLRYVPNIFYYLCSLPLHILGRFKDPVFEFHLLRASNEKSDRRESE